MTGDKKIVQSEPLASGLKSDVSGKTDDQNLRPRKNIASGATPPLARIPIPSAKGAFGNKATTEQGVHYPPTSCYDYQYPGHNGTYNQMNGMNSGGGAYTENGSLLYYMPSYNPYTGTYMGVDGQQQPYFSSSDYSWNSTYSEDTAHRKSAACSNSMKPNEFNARRTMNTYTGKSQNYPLDVKSRQHSTSTVPKSIVHSQDVRSQNKFGSGYQSGGYGKGYQPSGNYSSYSYQNQGHYSNYSMNYTSGARVWNENDRYKPREKSEEITRGPRSQNVNLHLEDEKLGLLLLKRDKCNLEEFQTKYDQAKFYVIKSYSEDDVHKCFKYDVWSSTPNGNKKLDAAFCDADGKMKIFLFFSVNGSGQFVGVAEMMGPVDYEKNMDFWQLDKWNGFFPVKWHIVKDVPNTMLRHIILENNDNRPVTYTRDTQEVGLKQGLEMLELFKSYTPKTSLLNDLGWYEEREKMLKAERISKTAFQAEKNSISGERIIGEGGSMSSSLITLTRKMSISSPKGDKSAS